MLWYVQRKTNIEQIPQKNTITRNQGSIFNKLLDRSDVVVADAGISLTHRVQFAFRVYYSCLLLVPEKHPH